MRLFRREPKGDVLAENMQQTAKLFVDTAHASWRAPGLRPDAAARCEDTLMTVVRGHHLGGSAHQARAMRFVRE